MRLLHQSTMDRLVNLRQQFTVHTMWECDFARMKLDDPNVAAFVANVDVSDPLKPRDAFYGGRTEAIALYQRADLLEDYLRIIYADINSLYPSVCFLLRPS